MRHRGRLMTHRALLTEVWGPAYADDVGTLRTHIANLRRKVEPPGARGYCAPTPASATAWRGDAPRRGAPRTPRRCGLDASLTAAGRIPTRP